MRRTARAALFAACWTLVPATQLAGQTTPQPSTLFPSWNEQVDALGIGMFSRDAQTTAFGARPTGCPAAGAVGFALGIVADLAWDRPLSRWVDQLPVSRIHTPLAGEYLPGIGATLGKALVCPRPLPLATWWPGASEATFWTPGASPARGPTR